MVVRGERRMADEAHKVIQKTRILTKLKIKEEEIIIFIVRNDIYSAAHKIYIRLQKLRNLYSMVAQVAHPRFQSKKAEF